MICSDTVAQSSEISVLTLENSQVTHGEWVACDYADQSPKTPIRSAIGSRKGQTKTWKLTE